jgi:hypothetical protein
MARALVLTPEQASKLFLPTSKKRLKLDDHDQALVDALTKAFLEALQHAHLPIAIVKRMHSIAAGHRNKGRGAAMKRHPFAGKCENSGLPLAREHAQLDEEEPEVGFTGKVRWVCSRANGNGKHSCGGCK